MANDTSTLPAQKRDQSGKGPSHRLRAKGLIPAICYGPYDKPLHVAIDPDAIKKAIATPHKFNTVISLQVQGGETRTVLLKDYEKDPLDGKVLHADFLEVRMDKDVTVNVPVVLTGKPEGVTAGGILQQVARTLAVQCKPSDIPEKIEVDVSPLKITESLHVSDVKAPAGVKFKVKGTRRSRWSTCRRRRRRRRSRQQPPPRFPARRVLLPRRQRALHLPRVVPRPRPPLALLPRRARRPRPPTRARKSKRCAFSSASATPGSATSAPATTSASASPRTRRGSWARRSRWSPAGTPWPARRATWRCSCLRAS